MTEISPIDLPKSRKILNFVFIVVSLILSLSSLAFYSLWRASEVTHSIDFSRENQSTTASDLVGAILPTTKPTAPSFIYPPSGDEKNNWQTISAGFTKEVNFEMALPKDLPYSKAVDAPNQSEITYRFFESTEKKTYSLACEKKVTAWLQKSSQDASHSGSFPPCDPDAYALFTLDFDTTTESAYSNKSSIVTSSNYREWSISESGNGEYLDEYWYSATTSLRDAQLTLKIVLKWKDKNSFDQTALLFGYDGKTLLNKLLTQTNFGESGMYGKTN